MPAQFGDVRRQTLLDRIDTDPEQPCSIAHAYRFGPIDHCTKFLFDLKPVDLEPSALPRESVDFYRAELDFEIPQEQVIRLKT